MSSYPPYPRLKPCFHWACALLFEHKSLKNERVIKIDFHSTWLCSKTYSQSASFFISSLVLYFNNDQTWAHRSSKLKVSAARMLGCSSPCLVKTRLWIFSYSSCSAKIKIKIKTDSRSLKLKLPLVHKAVLLEIKKKYSSIIWTKQKSKNFYLMSNFPHEVIMKVYEIRNYPKIALR